MAVYGYVRVSTQSQADDGLSLDAQQRQIEGYSMMHGMKLDHVFIERAVSGAKPFEQRPQGKILSETLTSGDVVICSKLDRLFRSARDALVVTDEFKARKCSLHLLDLGGDVSGNGISKMFFTIVASFAEFERDRIAERIADVKANEKLLGRFIGGSRPFGFQVSDDGTLEEDEVEQRMIKLVLHLRSEEKSYRTIADEVTNSGSNISHTTVKKIIQRQNQRAW
jgi:DNA invertase Pin-like site-specific DNA recombinase